MENNLTEIYKITLYNLPYNYIEILEEKLNKSSNEKFELIKINDLNNNLKEKSSVLLLDINEKITEEIRKYAKDNKMHIIRITDRPISIITNDDIVLSLSLENINNELINLEENKIITHFEYSINILKRIINITRIKKNSENIIDEESKNELINSLIKLIYIIDISDHYTKLHSLNVAKYSLLLGKELKLDDEDMENLRVGAILHDIGKIGVPASILHKEEKLTDDEYKTIKKHPIMGEMLLPENYKKIKQIIRNHHERYDGKGYPDGLKENNIPYLARIISIADSFDAMTTQRTYNDRRTLEEALAELRRCSKKEIDKNGNTIQQFDPALVTKFIIALKKDKVLMENFKKEDNKILQKRIKR